MFSKEEKSSKMLNSSVRRFFVKRKTTFTIFWAKPFSHFLVYFCPFLNTMTNIAQILTIGKWKKQKRCDWDTNRSLRKRIVSGDLVVKMLAF